MPIYEYHCPQCQLKFDLLRPMSRAEESAPCPRCHADARKLLSTFASLRGSTELLSPTASSSSPCAGCAATSCSTCPV